MKVPKVKIIKASGDYAQPWRVTIVVDHVPVEYEVDPGSLLTLMNDKTFKIISLINY
jgi:hypothetical protein